MGTSKTVTRKSRGKTWKNGKAIGQGTYERDSAGERIYVIMQSKPKKTRKTYESHEAAKKAGWKLA